MSDDLLARLARLLDEIDDARGTAAVVLEQYELSLISEALTEISLLRERLRRLETP